MEPSFWDVGLKHQVILVFQLVEFYLTPDEADELIGTNVLLFTRTVRVGIIIDLQSRLCVLIYHALV